MMFSQLGHKPLLKIAAFCLCVATITNNGSNYRTTIPYPGTRDVAQPLVTSVVLTIRKARTQSPGPYASSIWVRAAILRMGMPVKRLQRSNAYQVNMPDAGSPNPDAPCD